MDFPWIKFTISFLVISGGVIFMVWLFFFQNVEEARKRLQEDNEKAKAEHAALMTKLREAEEDLKKRQAEAKSLADKMKSEAEEESKAEREKMVNKAREEGEEIIAKARGAMDKLKQEVARENDRKVVQYSMEILTKLLSEKAKGAFDDILIKEFLENLKAVDMSRINPDVQTIDVITLSPLKEDVKAQLLEIIKGKLNRNVSITAKQDPQCGGGMMIKFGSMALDGTMQFLIRDSGNKIQEAIEV